MSWAATEYLLGALAQRQPIEAPVAMVVAHPDDETVGAGASLALFRNLTLVHVTDGAPRDMRDASAAGFASCEEYAAARQEELRAALRSGGIKPRVTRCLGVPDQQVALRLTWLAAMLRHELSEVSTVLTHAYEGGHPDHDAVAFAVHAVGVPVIEMAGYHAAADGGIEVGRFLSEDGSLVVPLTAEECSRREAMLACFATQRSTLAPFFGWTQEAFRRAPAYDFTRPPAPRAYYDAFDWGVKSARWCSLATKALRRCAS
jgi:LmbE family N-acetylglucosaminyl deacetylase